MILWYSYLLKKFISSEYGLTFSGQVTEEKDYILVIKQNIHNNMFVYIYM